MRRRASPLGGDAARTSTCVTLAAYTGLMAGPFAESLAPIVLPDADGCQTRLGALWERQPAVVVFLRHYG